MKLWRTGTVYLCLLLILRGGLCAQTNDPVSGYNEPPSRLRGVIEKFDEDEGSLNRFYSAPVSANRAARFRQFYAEWQDVLNKQNFGALNHDEQTDYLLFRNYLAHELKESERRAAQLEEMSPLVAPFDKIISDLEDSRRRLEPLDAAAAAALLNKLNAQIAERQKAL